MMVYPQPHGSHIHTEVTDLPACCADCPPAAAGGAVVWCRCRSLQRSVGRRLERDMTATQGMEAAATAEGRLGRLLELNGQLNRILAR